MTGVESTRKIWFYKTKWKSKICLCFAKEDFNSFWVGIGKGPDREEYNKEDENHKLKVFNALKNDYPNSYNDDEICYAWYWYFNDTWCPKHWSNNEEVWLNILDEDDNFYKKMKELLKKLSDLLDEV